ncbi:MAG: ATP-binding protein [Ignavibacteria bacterium]
MSDKIVISSNTKNLAQVRNFVANSLSDADVNPRIIDQIVLSVDEACTNIIKHTYKFEDGHNIEIFILIDNDSIKISIIYSGTAFDPNSREVPNMTEYFEKYKVGGLGIPLIKKFIDKIEYTHTDNNLNNLTLIKFLS